MCYKNSFFIELKVIRNVYFIPLKSCALFDFSDNVCNVFFVVLRPNEKRTALRASWFPPNAFTTYDSPSSSA